MQLVGLKHFLRFEELFAEICIFLQKDLEGVVCHSNFAVQSSRDDSRLQAKGSCEHTIETPAKVLYLLRGFTFLYSSYAQDYKCTSRADKKNQVEQEIT